MKKLLLVALVPLLVLGFMGCGKVFEGDVTPAELQGLWSGNFVSFVLSGNQATVFRTDGTDDAAWDVANTVYRTAFSGSVNRNSGTIDGDATLEFHEFDKPGKLIGTITFTGSTTSITIKTLDLGDIIVQTYMLPPQDSSYTKTPTP